MRPHCCGATPGCVPKAWRVWAQLCPLSLRPHLAGLASGDKESWGIPRAHTALLKARPGTHIERVQVALMSSGQGCILLKNIFVSQHLT